MDKSIKYPPEESIIEVLDNWLRNHAGQPTWREVAEALREIGLHQLAFNIEKVYDTGTFYNITMSTLQEVIFLGLT